MGKTFLLRLLAADRRPGPARRDDHAYDLKGTGDLSAAGSRRPPLPRRGGRRGHRLRAGRHAGTARASCAAARKVIRGLPRDICPESKVTPELADRKSLGLHPIVHRRRRVPEVVRAPRATARSSRSICTDLVKRGPALGIMLILATQRPDAKSLPTGISANAVLRLVPEGHGPDRERHGARHVARTRTAPAPPCSRSPTRASATSPARATPPASSAATRSTPPAPSASPPAPAPCASAPEPLSGHALGESVADTAAPPTTCSPTSPPWSAEPKLWSETVVTRLAELRPAAYGAWAGLEPEDRAAQLTAALTPLRRPHRPGVGHHRRRQGRQPPRHHPRRHHQSTHRT